MLKKFLILSIVFSFILTSLFPLPKVRADSVSILPSPGAMVNLSPIYQPVMMKGLTVHKDNPFLFDFIVDVGQDKMSGEPLKKEGEKLIKYFLASLAIPDKDVWVNLSPYEKDRIIPDALSQTEMGRDLLEQDYILKQITASLIYPEKQLGRLFWDKIYAQAQARFGTTQIPVNTFNKVWIVADKAEVFEKNQTAFVVGQHLKVMLEEDYLALIKNNRRGRPGVGPLFRRTQGLPLQKTINITGSTGASIIRQIILPELEKEVNQGQNFANLRQIFNSIILSSWYKKNLKNALLNQFYADKSQIKGILRDDVILTLNKMKGKDLKAPYDHSARHQNDIEIIYQQYLAAYKRGVFNYIKEDIVNDQRIPRKYFSGGINEAVAANPSMTSDPEKLRAALDGAHLMDFTTIASTANKPFDAAMMVSLEDEVNRAYSRQTDTVGGFIRWIHNDYWVATQKRLKELSHLISDLDPDFIRNIMDPEHVTSQWTRQMLMDSQGKEYEVDVLNVRVANNSAKGVPKGGIRALFNYFDRKPKKGQPRTASDLMLDPEFEKAFNTFNIFLKEYDLSHEDKIIKVKQFLQKWIEEEAKALSLWMSFKNAVMGLPLGGGKGVVFVGQIKIKDDGTASIEDTELWSKGKADAEEVERVRLADIERNNIASIAREYARTLFNEGRVGEDIDVPAPDKRTDGIFMGFATDEYIRLNWKKIKLRDPALFQVLYQVYIQELKAHHQSYPLNSTVLVEAANAYLHQYRKPVPELGVFTGKSLNQGGVVGRPSATGFGVASMIRHLLKAKDDPIAGKTLAIQGAGNVALYTALQAVRDGVIVQVLADERLTLIKANGFTEYEILELIRRSEKDKEKMFQIWKEVLKVKTGQLNHEKLRRLTNEDQVKELWENPLKGDGIYVVDGNPELRAKAVLEANVDILSPSATEGVITNENADRIKSLYIVPGANGPITAGALEILETKGKLIVPDTLANARGVLVSFFEQVQALTGHIFMEKEVAQIAERFHANAFSEVWAASIEHNVSLTKAADFVSAKAIIHAQKNMSHDKGGFLKFVQGVVSSIESRIVPVNAVDFQGIYLEKYETKEMMSARVALLMADQLEENNQKAVDTVWILPTGGTYELIYKIFRESVRARNIKLNRLYTFNMDEYCFDEEQGIDLKKDKRSYAYFMEENLYKYFRSYADLGWDSHHAYIPDGKEKDEDLEGKLYELLIKKKGGIQIAFGGLGPTAHLAFNDPRIPGDTRAVKDIRDFNDFSLTDIKNKEELLKAVRRLLYLHWSSRQNPYFANSLMGKEMRLRLNVPEDDLQLLANKLLMKQRTSIALDMGDLRDLGISIQELESIADQVAVFLQLPSTPRVEFIDSKKALLSYTRRVAPAIGTIRANIIYFTDDVKKMPVEAYTIGLGTLMDAKKVVIAASGLSKVKAVHESLTAPVTGLVPASVLHSHPNASFIIDDAAGPGLNPADRASVALPPGGIDLNTSNGMDWKISKDGIGVDLKIDPAMLAQFKAHGIESLSPVIVRITPFVFSFKI